MNNPQSNNQSIQSQLSQKELTQTLPQNQLQELTLDELESISGGVTIHVCYEGKYGKVCYDAEV